MYPANRDEIIKGLEDLINSIQKILQAVAAEKAAAPEPNAITEQGAASASSAEAKAQPTAAELLFAGFADADADDLADNADAVSAADAPHAAVRTLTPEEATPVSAAAEQVPSPASPADTATADTVKEIEVVEVATRVVPPVDLAQLRAESEDAESEKADADSDLSTMPALEVGEVEDATAEEKAPPVDPLEVRFKICKHVIMTVDNSMGSFHDMLDTMEYHQDEKYELAKKLVADLEECTAELVAYLRFHHRY